MNVFVSLNGGVPLSVTVTVTGKLCPPCDSSGVHEIAPVTGSRFMPAGPLELADQASVWAGRSESCAVGVNTKG